MSSGWQIAVAVIGTIGSLIAIVTFFTGLTSLRPLWQIRVRWRPIATVVAACIVLLLVANVAPFMWSSLIRSPSSPPRNVASIVPPASPTRCDSEDPGNRSRLELVSGEMNGHPIDAANPIIVARPGEPLTGSVDLSISSGFTYAAMAAGMTPSWGSHEHSMIDLGGFETPISRLRRTVPINLRAPSSEGEYLIAFVFRGEFNAAQILSATNWTTPNHRPIWNDGDDVADWTSAMIWDAIRNGRVCAPYRERSSSTYFYVPATALVVKISDQQVTSGGA